MGNCAYHNIHPQSTDGAFISFPRNLLNEPRCETDGNDRYADKTPCKNLLSIVYHRRNCEGYVPRQATDVAYRAMMVRSAMLSFRRTPVINRAAA